MNIISKEKFVYLNPFKMFFSILEHMILNEQQMNHHPGGIP
jgi:hypothetical protein